jgi:hypothetical protein
VSLENHTAVYCVVTQNSASEKYCIFRSCKVTLTSCGGYSIEGIRGHEFVFRRVCKTEKSDY